MSLKSVLAVALGILSAIGGFVDIGDLVFNTQAGATFGFQLLWAAVIGVVGIIVSSGSASCGSAQRSSFATREARPEARPMSSVMARASTRTSPADDLNRLNQC
jgi:hypothetical protein